MSATSLISSPPHASLRPRSPTLQPAVRDLEAEVVHWRCRAAELQRLLETTRLELDQVRSERDVVRRQAQAVRRRWLQQEQDYESRLNAARLDGEHWQRELQRLQTESGRRPSLGMAPAGDLRRVFTRLRERLPERLPCR